jgi:phosphoribosyl-ATP pyrophosphohydrolase/phosphoribosyl-AMP cyclohydrolase
MPQINGLIPAIVQDFHTGRVLMLAYVNQESYEYMLERGETCFWSRSRQKLWHKGETSGNTQKIKAMAFDCDKDTLLIQAEQTGTGACHTGSYSCFGDDEAGEFHILEEIYGQIADRKANPKEKSYTNYLLDAGLDKTCKKLGEEAAEVIIAAKNNDPAALAQELADLSYHALVLMLQAGVTPRDIAAVLANRHQKEGNLKEKNEKGAY